LAGFNAQLSAVLPHHRSSVVDDLRATYHAWLTTVARPLVYVAQKPRRSVGLLRRDKALMDHMRLDFNALFAAADAVDVRPEANSQRIVAVAVAVAALVVVLLSAMVLIAERRGEALDAERKQVFETVDELVGIADYDGHLIHLNAGWQRKLGYKNPSWHRAPSSIWSTLTIAARLPSRSIVWQMANLFEVFATGFVRKTAHTMR
jgi:hypothetical protein